ncbi:hypothetical protein [Pseudomonas sp. TCU-HL1]|uniref:hypothetical protein n=1 Tax=Pseudomonas sp. TCU-HL1 TaxID=1856685 RepID=UPI000855A2A5|nr:hypothetical protein [Pseudomonas sp. TCU-HL1]AOE88314.1 zonular occludens toxin subunit [Pseudomonas sp. TCU-HL1]
MTVNKNKLEFQNGESTRITIDKTYFGCYESVKDGTEHHFKFRIPRAAFALVGALALIGALGGYVYTRLSSFTEASEATVAEPAKSAATPAAAAAPAASASSSSQQQPHKTTAEYIAERTPRHCWCAVIGADLRRADASGFLSEAELLRDQIAGLDRAQALQLEGRHSPSRALRL